MKSAKKINCLFGVVVMVALLAGCTKADNAKDSAISKAAQPTGSQAPQPLGYGGGPSMGGLTQKHIEKCQAIKDNNKDISTLNYELQNAGCTLVDVRTYKR